MSTAQESQCTQLIHYETAATQSTPKELKEALEKGNIETKTDHMQKVIMLHLNGEPQSALLMTIIRFVLPSEDHGLKKLLLYFLEIIDKTDTQGKLLPEMILICAHLRNDLKHANQYVRGCTLRFVCKLNEEELIEPLTTTIVENLEHRHAYVRRNAVFAVQTVYQKFPKLLPDAPELMENFLEEEADISAKRNAFIMLFNCAEERAVRYLRKAIELDITAAGEGFQLAVVDLLKHMCKTNPQEKPQYLRVIFSLLSSKSPSVLFQCASTLLTLSSWAVAIRESAGTFATLMNSHADNNVKLIVLDRLEDIKKRFPDILAELQMDLLRTLTSPNMDIRRKVLDLSLDLVTMKTVDKVVQFLKKELVRTQNDTDGDRRANQEYRQMLVRAIHQSTVKHPSVAPSIVPVLLDYVIEPTPSAVDVILFIREIVEKQPQLREEVLQKLCGVFHTISSARVLRITLWIFGAHANAPEEVFRVFKSLKNSIGDFPLDPVERSPIITKNSDAAGDDDNPDAPSASPQGSAVTRAAGIAVREDGTYVTTLHEVATVVGENLEQPFRSLLVNGDFFLASVLANTLSKLVLALGVLPDTHAGRREMKAQTVETLNELLRMGANATPSIDDDSHERICLCMSLIQNEQTVISQSVLSDASQAFSELVKDSSEKEADEQETAVQTFMPIDSTVHFSQLTRGRKNAPDMDEEMEDIQLATSNESLNKKSDFVSRLNRVMQLTGFSDPVYAEATVTVHQFDILLDLLIVNQTTETMQNLTVELATVGDLKLCERPQNYTLGPHESTNIKANIKVSSTETGIIFGNIVYDLSSAANERDCVILNDIHIDIMDYISPAACLPTQFRGMWAEFEWENKVAVNTDIRDLRQYLDHILKHTNMKCLTSDSSLDGDCDFLSANLYAKSSFGEDALANISIERQPDGKIEGFVRIRSKTQGIALSLGDKITMKQKG